MRLGAEDAGGEAAVDPDCGRLVDDDDPVPVRVLEHLLGVRVVGRAEGVRAEPLQQREVVDHEGVVVRLPADRGVLVLAEAAEVERLLVDQEARPVDPHGPDADRQRVRVDRRVSLDVELDSQVVQVALARPPGPDVVDPELARRAGRACDLASLGVAEHDRDLGLPAARLDLVAHGSGRAVEARRHGHVLDVRRGRRVEPDRPVQAGVVEEVVEDLLPPPAVRGLLDVARRDRVPGEDVARRRR